MKRAPALTFWACCQFAAAPLFAQTVKGPITPVPAYTVPELDLPSAERTPVLQATPRLPAEEPLQLQSAADWVEEQLAARPANPQAPRIVVGAMPPFVIQRFSEGSAFDVSVDHSRAAPPAPEGETFELAPRAPIARAAPRPLAYRNPASTEKARPAGFNWRTWRRVVASIGVVSAIAVAAGYPAMNGVILFAWTSSIFTLFQRVVHEARGSKP